MKRCKKHPDGRKQVHAYLFHIKQRMMPDELHKIVGFCARRFVGVTGIKNAGLP